MFEKTQEFYLTELAEQMSGSWSKLGAEVGCYEPASEFRNFDFDGNDGVRALVKQSIEEGRAVDFEIGEGAKGLAVPVFCYGRCVGSVLCLLPAALADQADGLFDIFTRQLQQIHDNIQKERELTALSEQLAGSYEELSLIYKLGQHLQISDDPDRFLQRFADDLLELVGAQGLMLLIDRKKDGGEASYSAGRLPTSEDESRAACRYLAGLLGSVYEPIILPDLSAHPALVNYFKSVDYSLLAWPVCANGSSLGIIAAVGRAPYAEFDSADAKLLGSVAEHTGSFLQNRFLLTDIQDLLTGLLTSLVSAIDAKDPYTRGHSQRVAFIGQRIAESLGLSRRECDQIYMAGLLHDIGKIGITDQVLCKPGKLTREEFATVQEHPVIGSRIISSVKQLRNILPGVLDHHERYDGTGYPEGLKGEQIPLMGMIVGLADCFDAITSDRTYHDAMSFTDALTEIRRCTGTQFSPVVIRGLFDCDLPLLEADLKNLAQNQNDGQILPGFNWLDQCR